jgi:hypothetical protein
VVAVYPTIIGFWPILMLGGGSSKSEKSDSDFIHRGLLEFSVPVWEIRFFAWPRSTYTCTHLSSHKNEILFKCVELTRLFPVPNNANRHTGCRCTSHELVRIKIKIKISPKSALFFLVTCISFSLHQILCSMRAQLETTKTYAIH